MALALGNRLPGAGNRGRGKNPYITEWAESIAAAIADNPDGVMFDDTDSDMASYSGLIDPIQALETILRDSYGLDYSGTSVQYEGATGIDRGSERVAYGLTPARRRPGKVSSAYRFSVSEGSPEGGEQ